jgi:mannose-1-phosphate guanylyltransferase
VILVGGFGTRIRPLTYLNPKPMLPLVNKPFMEHFISRLKSYGIKEIILSTCYLPEVFTNYFGDGSKFGVQLECVTETCPLGTCGAVKFVEDQLKEESFMVFNGDILSGLDLGKMIDFHDAKKADITINLTPVEDPTAYGLVPIDEDCRVQQFLEKPSWNDITTNLINAGTYIIEPKVLELAPCGVNYSFERGLFPKALEKGLHISGFVSNSYWLDLGTPQKYITAHQDILERKLHFAFKGKEVLDHIYVDDGCAYEADSIVSGPIVIGKNTKIASGAKINPLTVIGNNCVIESGAEISGSVIYDGVTIGKNSAVRNSILSNNVTIGQKVIIEEYTVIGDNSEIGDENFLRSGIKININAKIGKGLIKF